MAGTNKDETAADQAADQTAESDTEDTTAVAARRVTENIGAGEVVAREDLRALNIVKIDDYTLRAWQNVADAMAEFESSGMEVYVANEVIGSGYNVIDKKELINRGFLLVNWRFTQSATGVYVVATGLTTDNPAVRFIITDGSTGLREQLMNETRRRINARITHINAGLLVPRGLVVSEYDTENEQGEPIKARTYYLSTQGA